MPNRPQSVPANATLIYPGQTFGPGLGVQKATLIAIQAQINYANAQKSLSYAGAFRDWTTNAQIYQSYGMTVPPPPTQPPLRNLNIIYADVSGNIVTVPGGDDGLHYAWVWES